MKNTKHTKKRKIYASVKQASSGMGLSISTLHAARDAGCEAFLAGGQVDEAAMLSWASANPEALKVEGGTLKEQKTFEEVRKLRLNNDYEEGILMKRTEHDAELAEMTSEITRLCNVMPSTIAPELAGKPVQRIETDLKAWVKKLMRALNTGQVDALPVGDGQNMA